MHSTSTNLPPAQPGWLSIIVPAHNEASYIGSCLEALLAQSDARPVQVVLAANGCTDDTVQISKGFAARFEAKGWQMDVLDLPALGKLGALNRAEASAIGAGLVYLDADVICAPALLRQLRTTLDTDTPRYATGTMQLAEATSWVTRHYGRLWMALPFMQGKAPGAGVFAVNRAGRARWDAYPQIISDDTFVRLNFAPSERVQVPATYRWPLVEGFGNLVQVRRRQNAGVAELHRLYPELFANDDKTAAQPAQLFSRMPVSFAVYVAVTLAVKLRRGPATWTRGR